MGVIRCIFLFLLLIHSTSIYSQDVKDTISFDGVLYVKHIVKAGESLKYTYTYHEMKFIVDGSFTIEDETGQKQTVKAGDLLYFPKGTAMTFTTDDFGLGFFCGQRGEGEA